MVNMDIVLNRYKRNQEDQYPEGQGETGRLWVCHLGFPLKVIMKKKQRPDILTPTALPWEREKLLLEDYTTYRNLDSKLLWNKCQEGMNYSVCRDVSFRESRMKKYFSCIRI